MKFCSHAMQDGLTGLISVLPYSASLSSTPLIIMLLSLVDLIQK